MFNVENVSNMFLKAKLRTVTSAAYLPIEIEQPQWKC